MMEDSQIIDLYWHRDEDAITQSGIKYGRYCHTIAYNVLKSDEDSEECVNDTWLRAWNCIPPERPNKLAIYLGTITRNLSLDRWKYKNAAKRGEGEMSVLLDELEECIPGTQTTEEIVEGRELERMINDFLKTLPEKDCNVFLRRYWYAEELATIADEYGMKLNSVKTTLFRTREKLRKYLGEAGVMI